MNASVIAFTARGMLLAERIAAFLDAKAVKGGKGGISIQEFAREGFSSRDALIFVGAAGIAVRAIAPFVVHKAQDPAVVVVDEGGSFVIPILSGHLGGSNELASRIADYIKATPVITTATDVNGVFAVDTWAKSQGCCVVKPSLIKEVSSAVLEGRTVPFVSDYPISGTMPGLLREAKAGETPLFSLSVRTAPEGALPVVPKIGVLGIGCKRDTPADNIEELFNRLFSECGIYRECISEVCSIDLKANEQGLISFCRAHALPFRTFTSEELQSTEGEFTASEFVSSITGVDNVCERSAVFGSGGGSLIIRKTALNGVTMALALKAFEPNWR